MRSFPEHHPITDEVCCHPPNCLGDLCIPSISLFQYLRWINWFIFSISSSEKLIQYTEIPFCYFGLPSFNPQSQLKHCQVFFGIFVLLTWQGPCSVRPVWHYNFKQKEEQQTLNSSQNTTHFLQWLRQPLMLRKQKAIYMISWVKSTEKGKDPDVLRFVNCFSWYSPKLSLHLRAITISRTLYWIFTEVPLEGGWIY